MPDDLTHLWHIERQNKSLALDYKTNYQAVGGGKWGVKTELDVTSG